MKSVWKNGERFDRSGYRRPVVEAATAAPATGPQSPQEALEQWLSLWRRYDLDRLDEVFLQDPTLTYFASDSETAREGFEAVRAYHEEQGFARGGFEPDNDLWLEETLVANFENSAVVTAVWYFGNQVLRDEAAHGPLTMVIVRTSDGFRIAHVNMGAYSSGGGTG